VPTLLDIRASHPYLYHTAIGLQYTNGFKSFFWVSTLPPIFIILVFKIWIRAKFSKAFRYYMPTEEELHQVKTHSERADNRGHRLEKRFGHPALNVELFTPMLHAKMMPLLAEVYKGRIDSDHAMLNEYGGQKAEAQIVEGGVKFAAVDQVRLSPLTRQA
jgi:calcium permeable stress-gated cation channel